MSVSYVCVSICMPVTLSHLSASLVVWCADDSWIAVGAEDSAIYLFRMGEPDESGLVSWNLWGILKVHTYLHRNTHTHARTHARTHTHAYTHKHSRIRVMHVHITQTDSQITA